MCIYFTNKRCVLEANFQNSGCYPTSAGVTFAGYLRILQIGSLQTKVCRLAGMTTGRGFGKVGKFYAGDVAT